MILRNLSSDVRALLGDYPAVALLGMRQIGKTTLAKDIANGYQGSLYLDLELPDDRLKLDNPSFFLGQFSDRLVVIDEVQVMPELFGILRALIDRDRRPGRFLLLGSSSPSLMRGASDSLAGRIAFTHLHPIDINEVGEDNINRLWLRGGLPLAYLSKSDTASYQWMRNYIKSYVERDLPALGVSDNPVLLTRLLQMLAHFHGQLINYDQIARSLQVTGPTVRRYVEMLEQAFLIFTLPPLVANTKKRLVKSPKVYFTDSGMLHALLNINSLVNVFGNPQAGASWEGFVISQIRAIIGDAYQYAFFRTYEGAEADLVLSRGGENIYSIEIKLSDSPSMSKGYYGNRNIIKAKHNVLLTPGSDKFFVREDVGVISVMGLLEDLRISQ